MKVIKSRIIQLGLYRPCSGSSSWLLSNSPPAVTIPSIAGEEDIGSLNHYGTAADAFRSISDKLTNNALIKDGETYDPQRLSAEALQELFLQLLHEELKAEAQNGDDGTSKKRKIQSPVLPSIKDAVEYADKLPILVQRLYARYREYMIQSIRDDERKYESVKKDIGEIERGEWDERILKEDKTLANGNGSPESSRAKLNGTETGGNYRDTRGVDGSYAPGRGPLAQSQSTEPGASGVVNSQEPYRSSSAAHDQSGDLSQAQGSQQQKSEPNIHGPPPPVSVPIPPNVYWAPPYQPPHGQQYNTQYANPQYSPRQGAVPTAHLPPQFPVPSSPLNTYNKNLQPPNPNVQNHGRPTSSSPGTQLTTLADTAGQHGGPPFRGHSGSPMLPPQGHIGGHPQQFQQQTPQQQHWQQGSVQHGPGMSFPPNFQGYMPSPGQHSQSFQTPQSTVQSGPAQYNSPYHASQGRPPGPLHLRSQPVNYSNPSTPRGQSSQLHTTGWGTKWTPTPSGPATDPRRERARTPEVEPLSPIQRPAKLPEPPKKTIKTPKPEALKPNKVTKRGTKRTRAGSPASSVIAGSHRSQSVMSHADELSIDEPIGGRVKEEVATPSGMDLDETADESSVQPQLPPHLSQSLKRKRALSTIEPAVPSGPPTHVLWTRAFPKISNSALESISAHKNASTFSNPVKERDAPGYKTLILRPQDLKSIKSAIIAGNRAATAAQTEEQKSSSASNVQLPISEDLIPPKGIINYAQLEKELMRMFANAIMFNADPDRGLGESWEGLDMDKDQGVGYEFVEDGVVNETRDMYLDVQKIVVNLRRAERTENDDAAGFRESSVAVPSVAEEESIDELAGESEARSVAKKRRRG